MEKGGFPSEFMNYGNGDENPLMTTSSLLNLNWEAVQSSTEQAANFESALSSLASSPTSSSNPNPTPNLPSHSVVIRELIGRLGSICSNSNGNNSNHNSPPNSQYQSTSTSCYTAPLHSPPNLSFRLGAHHQPPVMPPFAAADPGFAERAAKFSCFGATRNYAPFCEPGSLSSGQSLKAMDDGASFQLMQQQQQLLLLQDGDQGGGQSENIEMIRRLMMIKSGNGHSGGIAEPSVSGNANVRKRKASSSSKGVSRGKDGAPDNPPKAAAEEKPSSKRCRSGGEPDEDEVKTPKAEQAVNNGTGTDTTDTDSAAGNKDKDSNAKAPEPPKQDYIHVRARRGQATDSHSLAERVRREKISERMKFLQDLVPGCDKVTGKAVMLDEIINYVQSLQRQVEFLSMKLATVNPLADISVDSLLPKDMHQPGGLMLAPHSSYPLEATSIGMFSYANQPQEQVPPLQSLISNGLETPLDASIRRSLSMHLPSLDGLTDASASQLGAFWEDDDLQSVVQMGFGQNQELIFSSQNFPGPPPTSHMKIEL